MGDEQPGRKAAHLRPVSADANAAPAPARPGAACNGSRFVLDSGFALCGACGACLTGQHDAGGRLYVCGTPRGGCGLVRVPADAFEARVAARALAELAAPSAWRRLAELDATGGGEPPTAEGLAQWWAAADFSARQAMIGVLLDHVRVAPAVGEELGLVDDGRLSFAWASAP